MCEILIDCNQILLSQSNDILEIILGMWRAFWYFCYIHWFLPYRIIFFHVVVVHSWTWTWTWWCVDFVDNIVIVSCVIQIEHFEYILGIGWMKISQPQK